MVESNALNLTLDLQEFTWLTGLSFRGLTVSKRGIGWQVTIRACTPDGLSLFMSTKCSSPAEGLAVLVKVQGSKSTRQLWLRDKFASRRRPHKGG